jgi:hypothetical protein
MSSFHQLNLRSQHRSGSRIVVAVFALLALLAGLLAGGGQVAPANAAPTATINGTISLPVPAVIADYTMMVYAFTPSGEFGAANWVDSSGKYTLNLEPGTYKLQFTDSSDRYAFQWWSGKSTFASATSVAVTEGSAVTGINFSVVAAGTVSGKLTDAAGRPLGGTAVAYTAGGEVSTSVVGQGYVNPADGTYSIPGLAAGSYKVGFSTAATAYSYSTGALSPSDPYVSQWYSAKYSYDTADSVTVTAGQAKTGINAALENPTFADVIDPTYQFYPAIQWMAQTGISQGTAQPQGKPLYKPADAVSRQAMASFLFKMSGGDFVAPATPTFADVDASSPFYTAIEWMASRNITTGTAQPNGKPLYKATDPVSRQAMALFLARFSGVEGLDVPPTSQSFADVPTSSAPAAAIAWMKSRGISTGTTQPSGLPLYKPSDPVSRQAMAAFLFRLQ